MDILLTGVIRVEVRNELTVFKEFTGPGFREPGIHKISNAYFLFTTQDHSL